MSRAETHDYDYPPGLGVHHHQTRSNERDQGAHYSAAYQQQDRRSSNAGQGYPGFGGAISRSYGMQDAYGIEIQGPNRHNPTPSLAYISSSPSFPSYSHHNHRPSPPPSIPAVSVYTSSSSPNDRDNIYYRHTQVSNPQQSSASSLAARSTLWWGELEPWMDEEYAKQVCGLMGWDPVNVKVPHPAPDPATGQQPNNPGYCFLTFPTPAQAASVLAQINNGGPGGRGTPIPMPNSSKPFVVNWASSIGSSSPMSAGFPAPTATQSPAASQQFPKEYSIFVGDLAPETSNSDLVAVFRNPVLGLRNDREPKFIRPFLSCKSAKIMLDPLTGVSRGYGFVRFTDEADQQRALIEMHGLYCLSRPMRISPATAKFKPPTSVSPFDTAPASYAQPVLGGTDQSVTIALPLPTTQTKSVSAPIAETGSGMSFNTNAVSSSTSGSSMGNSYSSGSLSSGAGSSASIATSVFGTDEALNSIPQSVLTQIALQYTNNDLSKLNNLSPYHEEELRRIIASQVDNPSSRYIVSEESWKHHAQARAILGNLMGPNGEQLTSTDPYNTTVFVGGLSPLISEETLRTFFAPFGDIHYVKVPVGKHCGFVQFVRKADAEKAIEKMQGFPIGGSRIRLSWGRSQYKAAQAAAQAAQAAALQTSYAAPIPVAAPISQDHALAILQKFGMSYPPPSAGYDSSDVENALLNNGYGGSTRSDQQKTAQEETNAFVGRPELLRTQSNFSPFSPDPNSLYTSSENVGRGANAYSRLDLPHPSKAYAPGFFPQQQEIRVNTAISNGGSGKVSPASARPASASRYSFAENSDPPAPMNRAPGRGEAPISRPGSGQMSAHAGHRESDPIHDLNGTLASLELDRTWKASGAGNRVSSG